MADFADTASDISAEHLNLALHNRPQFEGESKYECVRCGSDIPEQRRALGNVTLCINCQTSIENHNRHFRHFR